MDLNKKMSGPAPLKRLEVVKLREKASSWARLDRSRLDDIYNLSEANNALSFRAQAADAAANRPSRSTQVPQSRDRRCKHRNPYARPSAYSWWVLPALQQQGGTFCRGVRREP